MSENYTHARLQFGENDLRVPGYQNDAHANDKPVEIPAFLAAPNQSLWAHIFTHYGGGFYLTGQDVNAAAETTVNSWYSPVGKGPGGDPALRVHPFADGGFLKTDDFVDFSEPTPYPNWIDTSTIMGPTATATAHYDLPQLASLKISSHASNQSVFITTEITRYVFDHYFIIWGPGVINGNQLTVQKEQGCLALAVYKKESTTSTKEIGTMKWPKIPKSEWPQIVEQVVQAVLVKGNGEIWEHFSSRQLSEVDRETLKMAVEEVGMRVGQLENLKLIIASLAERR